MVDETGYMSIKYNTLIPILTEAMKEQQKKINKQQEDLEELKREINSVKALLSKDKTIEKSQLLRNSPNPFSDKTEISFYIPIEVGNAYLTIVNLEGKVMKQIEVKGRGLNSITLEARDMQQGVYVCTLNVDGKNTDSIKLSISKD